VDVGDLGILAAHYGTGVTGALNFEHDYAQAFELTSESQEATFNYAADETFGPFCGGLGLVLMAGLMLACRIFLK
jgi:hypothetical protein